MDLSRRNPIVLQPVFRGEGGSYLAATEVYIQGIVDEGAVRKDFPVLSADETGEKIWRQYSEGITHWPVREWIDIHIV